MVGTFERRRVKTILYGTESISFFKLVPGASFRYKRRVEIALVDAMLIIFSSKRSRIRYQTKKSSLNHLRSLMQMLETGSQKNANVSFFKVCLGQVGFVWKL